MVAEYHSRCRRLEAKVQQMEQMQENMSILEPENTNEIQVPAAPKKPMNRGVLSSDEDE